MEKRNAVFRFQCYAIERHFQGIEYNSLTSALFVSTSRLNQWEKGFYCVTIYPQKECQHKNSFPSARYSGSAFSTAYVGFTYIGLSNVGKTYVGKSNAIK
jgi:hypothetical protein